MESLQRPCPAQRPTNPVWSLARMAPVCAGLPVGCWRRGPHARCCGLGLASRGVGQVAGGRDFGGAGCNGADMGAGGEVPQYRQPDAAPLQLRQQSGVAGASGKTCRASDLRGPAAADPSLSFLVRNREAMVSAALGFAPNGAFRAPLLAGVDRRLIDRPHHHAAQYRAVDFFCADASNLRTALQGHGAHYSTGEIFNGMRERPRNWWRCCSISCWRGAGCVTKSKGAAKAVCEYRC